MLPGEPRSLLSSDTVPLLIVEQREPVAQVPAKSVEGSADEQIKDAVFDHTSGDLAIRSKDVRQSLYCVQQSCLTRSACAPPATRTDLVYMSSVTGWQLPICLPPRRHRSIAGPSPPALGVISYSTRGSTSANIVAVVQQHAR
jgi:hypothetical protein